jgi:hypothetical protein
VIVEGGRWLVQYEADRRALGDGGGTKWRYTVLDDTTGEPAWDTGWWQEWEEGYVDEDNLGVTDGLTVTDHVIHLALADEGRWAWGMLWDARTGEPIDVGGESSDGPSLDKAVAVPRNNQSGVSAGLVFDIATGDIYNNAHEVMTKWDPDTGQVEDVTTLPEDWYFNNVWDGIAWGADKWIVDVGTGEYRERNDETDPSTRDMTASRAFYRYRPDGLWFGHDGAAAGAIIERP